MNAEFSRRDVLKTGAILAAASAIGGVYNWHVPGEPSRVILPGDDDHSDPATIPADVNEVEMTLGRVVAATPIAMADAAISLAAFERCRRAIGADLLRAPDWGWVPMEMLREAEHETKPGGDHTDPLQENWLFAVKQVWTMRRIDA